VRVASIQRRIELGKKSMEAVLEVIGDKTRELDERFRSTYAGITSVLANEGIHILTDQDILKQKGRPNDLAAWLDAYFRMTILPSLVPMIIQRSRPFPELTDGTLYFGVRMMEKKPRYAILEIPSDLPRFVQLPNGNMMYVDDLIRLSLNEIFYIFDYEAIEAFEFKISRDAELDMDNDFSEGYVRKMEKSLQKRRAGRPTRLVYDAAMPPDLLELLRTELRITEDDTLIGGGRYHNMRDLMQFPNSRPDLSYEKMPPAPHPVLDRNRTQMLDVVEQGDVLITYPYQSFDHLIRLLREAAIDPKVTAIKMTLYRAAHGSHVVNALYNAARNGKKIFVSIELQARFDEKHNIKISETLSEVGATVVYGVPPMKTHGKLLLIERGDVKVAGLSTGNFNEVTGKLYVDSTLLTANPQIAREVAQVFDLLDDAAKMRVLTAPRFKHLLVSPFNPRKVFMKLLAREKAKGKDGYVFIKVNHLTDDRVIEGLLQAADAGVKMDLVVRTTYAMLPHPNIRAISILDRYLEHQRAYVFGKGPDRAVFLSSADLMERNLDRRVEVAFPIYDAKLQQEVADMMALQVRDDCKARILDETQSNRYVGTGVNGHRTQYDTYAFYQALAGLPVKARKKTAAKTKQA
jgi:polyphosphate kinase